MNELLQKHGCSNVFSIPEGLRELMADISREASRSRRNELQVLREQPNKMYDFIANYLSVLLVTREHGILAVKILEDLCDCKPSVSEHLIQLGMVKHDANMLAQIIKEEVESVVAVEGREKIREEEILKKVLKRSALDEELTAQVCEVARNAYRDYWYRKKLLEQNLKVQPDQPWEIAAQHTLEIYKKTKPSYSELTRATQRIQAAYKGYYVRKKMLNRLQPKKKQAPKAEVPGPPTDIADAREMDLGRVVDVTVKVDPVEEMFAEEQKKELNLGYNPHHVLTYHEPQEPLELVGVEKRASRHVSTDHPLEPDVFGSPKHDTADASHTQSKHDTITSSHSKHDVEAAPTPIPPEVPVHEGRISFGAPEYVELVVEPPAPEVPEEIPTEIPDDDSAPATSVPSSAPDTARSELEDTADTAGATTEEEGEE